MNRSEVLPAVLLRIQSVWDNRKCSLVSVIRRFEDHVAFIIKGQAVQERNLKFLIPEDVGIANLQSSCTTHTTTQLRKSEGPKPQFQYTSTGKGKAIGKMQLSVWTPYMQAE